MKKTLQSLILLAAVAAAVTILPTPVQAGQPQTINVSVPSQFSAAITNTAIVTNTATAFRPPQGVGTRLTISVSSPGGITTSNTTVGFNLSTDAGNTLYGGVGTNFTTGVPLSVTFVPDTNFVNPCIMTAYLPATNWDGVTGARLDRAQTGGTNTINWVHLDYTP